MKTALRAPGNRALLMFGLALTLTVFTSIFTSQITDAQKHELAPESGTITGRVFSDYNSNGSYDTTGGTAAGPTAIDVGVANVTVSAFDSAGVARGTAVSIAGGTYSLAATGTGPYRLEFTNLPAGYSPSARSASSANGNSASTAGSTVHFVPDGNTANVNLAINRPVDYCGDNPDICSQLYGVGGSNQIESVFSIPYWGGSTRTTLGLPYTDFQAGGNTSLATTDQVGTTFGLAYHRASRRIFAASYMKKHAKFGPAGTGAIYQIDRSTGTVSTFVDLNAVFGPGTAGANLHNPLDYNTDGGQPTWDAVGKVAFGGIALNADETILYAMNLADRKLYRIPTSGPLDGTTIQSVAFPTSFPNTCTEIQIRPFAVTWYEGLIYVGAVCSRENEGTAPSTSGNLRGYVYTVNPATFTFSAAPVLNFQLNYSRAETDPGLSADWLNWETMYHTISSSHFIYPQPMMTDIEFDRGNMILGLRDRNGDQSGYNSSSNPNNATQLSKGITAGDMLRACGTPALGWTLESNARCGGIGAGPQSNGEGPGNGEYYYQDNYHPNGTPHDEVALGGMSQIPGQTVMVATIFDPAYLPNDNIYDTAGFRWFNNDTGAQNRGYLAYAAGDFGKANGLGNAQTLCEAAPIEIGNRVWRDSNGNGVQDSGENPIAGITVRLYQNNILVGTAVTDANGEYYFVGSTVVDGNTGDAIGQVNGGVLRNTAYQVRFDNPTNYNIGQPLAGLRSTAVNQTFQNGDDDSSDSDAVQVVSPVGSPVGIFPVISLTTGGAGANNHTFDVGFMLSPTAASVSLSGRVLTEDGRGIKNVRVYLLEADGTQHSRTSSTFGYYNFDDIEAGQSVVVSVSAKRFTFPQPVRLISVTDSVEGFDFVAAGEGKALSRSK